MAPKRLPFPFPLAEADIARKRAVILSRLCAADSDFCTVPIRALNPGTLHVMLRAYDEQFLCGFLSRRLSSLQIACSSRLVSSAGKFICTKGPFGVIKNAEIRISSDFFLRLTDGPFQLNGLTAGTPQEALLIVFEHELCHALETLLYRGTGHSDRFLSLAHGLFGHMGTRHSLPTRRQEAAVSGLHIGTRVSFSHRDQELAGIVTYIGKTATVMVPSSSGAYRSSSGARYEKYRVPLSRMTII